MKGTNVRISEETHAKLVAHTEKTGMKIGKFVDKAVLKEIEPAMIKISGVDLVAVMDRAKTHTKRNG